MKYRHLLRGMLVALLAFTFTACDNEPLEGQFVTDDGGDNTLEEGQFTAMVNGETFNATSSTVTLTDGVLFISGIADTGDIISIIVNNAGLCTYDLSLITNPATYTLNGEADNPFGSFAGQGGSGSMSITSFDSTSQTVSGIFNFIATREVVDGSGNTTTETVTVTEGMYTELAFTVSSGSAEPNDCTTGGGGGVDPEASFFALVNGTEFEDITFTAELVEVAGEPMVKLIATALNSATFRIDIPEGLGTGTFDFVDPVSDGTKLIAIYTTAGGDVFTSGENPGTGSITITEFGNTTGKLAATFSFLGTDSVPPLSGTEVEVTEGSFNTDYIDNTGGIENSFSASVDGVEYLPNSIEVTQAPFEETTIINVTTVMETTNQSVTVSFPIDIEVGSYEMAPLFEDGTEKVGIYNPDIGNSILFKSNPGILNITSYELNNGIIEATFSFTAVDPTGNDSTEYAISDGQFTIQIQ